MTKERRILVIGDLHAPFIREGYLEFCKKVYKEQKCNMVVCTGDVIDSHAASYHEADPDGMSAGDELSAAIEALQPWKKAFPKMKICIGNHDRMAMRKAFSAGVSKRWVKDYNDVLGCPKWEFEHKFIIDNVCYVHGEGQNLKSKMASNRMSYVGGHRHSELYVVHSVSDHDCLFAMQIGWGGEQESYAVNYARDLKRGVVSCGVVLKDGTMPIPIPMPLKNKVK